MRPQSFGYLILDTIRRFAMSADETLLARHVPRHGSLLAASHETLQAVDEVVLGAARHTWRRMIDANDPIPMGHDGYLKLWALGEPIIAADFILMDEAQDTNPVVLEVLRSQQSQMIYVGDKYQQIYEWRGAVNATNEIETNHTVYLTTSFRFGSEIAEAATNIIRRMGESRPVQGNPALKSRLGPVGTPHAILARTNASTMTALVQALDAGKRPHLVDGPDELKKMLRGVIDLKDKKPSDVPEFFGFADWREVVEFSRGGEGEHLQTFVNFVESQGERKLLWALGRTVDEEKSNLVISTAHKAKGREWKTVRLMDDFLKSQPSKRPPSAGLPSDNHSELRLLYVAVTRAQEAIELPAPVLELLGVAEPVARAERETSEIGGRGRQTSLQEAWRPPQNRKPKCARAGWGSGGRLSAFGSAAATAERVSSKTFQLIGLQRRTPKRFSCHRFARRHPAPTASASLQNQRCPALRMSSLK